MGEPIERTDLPGDRDAPMVGVAGAARTTDYGRLPGGKLMERFATVFRLS